MRVAIHSDLHTEFSLCRLQSLEACDLLILAGDIGDRASLPIFFKDLRHYAPDIPVLMVLGNHDYWGFSLQEAEDFYRALCEKYQVRLLVNEAVIFNEVLFCGTTLWSDFLLASNATASMAWAERLPDFSRILEKKGVPLSPQRMQALCFEACAFLKDALTRPVAVRKKVVISHFLPARELVAEAFARPKERLIQSAYWTSDLPEIYGLCDVWIYGHSHHNIECNVAGTQFLCNQRGYSRVFNAFDAQSAYRPDYVCKI